MSRLSQVLSETMDQIESKFRDEVAKKNKAVESKYFKSLPKFNKIQQAIEDKQALREQLGKEIDELKNQKDNLDPRLSQERAREFFIELTGVSNPNNNYWNNPRKSAIVIDSIMYKSKEQHNYNARQQMKRQINSQFNLCVTEKQRQQVIL